MKKLLNDHQSDIFSVLVISVLWIFFRNEILQKTDEIFKGASIAIEYALDAILPTRGILFSRHFFAAGFTTSIKTPETISLPLGKLILKPSTVDFTVSKDWQTSFIIK